jgi:hypothetical protein
MRDHFKDNLLMKILITIIFMFSLLAPGLANSQQPSDIKLLAHIEKKQKVARPLDVNSPQIIPFKLKSETLNRVIENLKVNEDALLEGYISQEKISKDDKTSLKPIFIVTKITPISLEKLGKLDNFQAEKKALIFSSNTSYQPKTLPLSDQAFQTITLTATILLLKGLAGGGKLTSFEEKTENLALFSAGALATGAQIFEDLSKKH